MAGLSPRSFRRYSDVVITLAQREFVGRYRGNLLGLSTAVLVPLLFLLAYTLVFSKLVQIQLRPDATRVDYAFFFFAGLLGWTLFAETTARAPRLFSAQAHFVRRALFPSSALAVAAVLTAFYQALIACGVLVLGLWVLRGSVPVTALLAPLLLGGVALFTAGVALALASLGIFVRDLLEVVGPLLSIGMFISPVLYPAAKIAAVSPWLVRLNPLAPLIEGLRRTLLDGAWPDPAALALAAGWSALALLLGASIHRRLRPGLADLL